MPGLGLGLGLGLASRSGGTPAPTPAPSAPITAVAADGWTATGSVSSTPFNFTAAGYDSTGTLGTTTTAITSPTLVRNVYPNQGTNSANVALSLVVPQGATISGVTNNSTQVSPKPVCVWGMRDRQLVGNTIAWEILAFHYYGRGRQFVPCVQVRATDGTNTTGWQTISTTSLSTYCEDANPLEVFAGSLDITALNSGFITLQAQVPPFVGGAGSVRSTGDTAVAREFSPRYFYKDATRAAAPPLAYVASTGNDTTGVWSTTAATAAATPFLTVAGAFTAMNDATRGTPATGGFMDGCRIRLVDTVSLGGGPATARTQYCAAVVVERAPGTARASAIGTWSVAFRPRLGVGSLLGGLTEGAICWEDMTLSRTAAVTMQGEAANNLQVHLRNATINNTSTTSNINSSSHTYYYGVSITGTVISLGQSTGTQKRIIRGVTADLNNTSLEGWVNIGCNFTRPNGLAFEDASKGLVLYGNKWLNPSSTGGVGTYAGSVSGGDIGPFVAVQNLVETTHTTASTAGLRFANDAQLGNLTHSIVYANTHTGYRGAGRQNQLYDEAAVARTHKLHLDKGNIYSQLNTKGDVFQADATRLGQFAYTHGVGCQGNFSQFRTNSAVAHSEMQTYPGLGSSIGTSDTIRNDPLFTNYQGSTNEGGAAGAGGGVYTLQGGSPARGIVTDPLLRYDLAGAARASANDAAGAYA